MKTPTIQRSFVANDIVLKTFEDVEGYFNELLTRELNELDSYKKWLCDVSELEAFLEEDGAWRYIKMSINTTNPALTESYTYFVTEIQPKLAPLTNDLNKKMMASEFHKELSEDPAYAIYFRSVGVQLDLFREENIAIEAYLSEKSQEYGSISAAQTIEHDGKTLTMQQASVYLKNQDETLRSEVYHKIATRRRQDIDTLNV